MKEQQPLLEIILKYLIDLDKNNLLALAIIVIAEEDNKKDNKKSTDLEPNVTANIQSLLDSEENIIAFEMMFYCYKQLVAKKNNAKNIMGLISNSHITGEEDLSQAMECVNRVRNILELWYKDPKRIETMVSFLTKIYKKQLTILEELMKASTEAINQITSFGIILNSQIVTMKNITKKTEEQRKCTVKLPGSDIDKRELIVEIDNNRQQINDMTRLEQYASSKIFPTLVKKLKHDYEIFYSKHRFMEEEFKIFLHERHALTQDSVYSELSVANIYDLLKRIQRDITKEIEFGGDDV